MTLPSQRPTRRRVDGSDGGSAYSTKEVILRVEAKLDAYIAAHETRHRDEASADYHPLTDHSETNLVTLAAAEVIYSTDPQARATQVSTEVIYQAEGDLRATLVGVEVMYLEEPRPVQFRAQIIG